MAMSLTSCSKTPANGDSHWYPLASPLFSFSRCAAARSAKTGQSPVAFSKYFFDNATQKGKGKLIYFDQYE